VPRHADEPISFAIKCPIAEAVETRQQEAAELAAHKENMQEPPTVTQTLPDDQSDLMISESLGHFPDLRPQVEGDCTILEDIKKGYATDPLCTKVFKNVGHYKNFETINGLLYTCNRTGNSVLCIPSVIQNKWRMTEVIISQAHKVLGHFGPQKIADYVWRHYWWPRISQDIEQYCKTCLVCQMTKSST